MAINGRYIRAVNLHWDRLEDKNSYVRDIECLARTECLEFNKNITFFVGANGSGKSTLLKAIAMAYGFPAEGGTPNFYFSSTVNDSGSESGFYDFKEKEELSSITTLIKGYKRAKPYDCYYFRAESFFNVGTAMLTMRGFGGEALEYGDRGGMHEQSHGQSYESFMEHFVNPGVFLLDEPESALSPQAQLSLLKHMNDLRNQGAQFIIATHSPILLAMPDVDIISFDSYELKRVFYEDTDIVKLYQNLVFWREALIAEALK